jgi:hypothetical protein
MPATKFAVPPWRAGCKSAGFDAVEIDKLDAYRRSNGFLTADEAVENNAPSRGSRARAGDADWG